MKKLRIQFIDFWKDFDYNTFLPYQILCRHYQVEISDTPDYVFFCNHGIWTRILTRALDPQYDECVKIYFTNENTAPNFVFCDYAIGLDPIQFGDRYFRYPYHFRLYRQAEDLLSKRGKEPETRQKFCSFVYSNNEADPYREKLFAAINSYKPVDSAGKVHHTVDMPINLKLPFIGNTSMEKNFAQRIAFENSYRFSIACENSQCPGYCTEKILLSFMAGTVPVYWGDPLVKETYNPEAFICAMDFPTLEDLVQRIREVDNDPVLYRKMVTAKVFRQENYLEEQTKKLETFLCHIFDQPKEQAFRRNRVFWGKMYLENIQKYSSELQRLREIDSRYAIESKLPKARLKRAIKNALTAIGL